MKKMCTITLLIISLASCKSRPKEPTLPELTYKLGEVFKLDNIVDTSGKHIQLDLSVSDISIVDIWNSNCPPCIAEMKKFPDLIKGKASRISVFSISVNQFWNWKPLVKNHRGPFSFLDYDVPNWKQYNLMTKDDPRLKNTLAIDRLVELGTEYHVTGNPAYFVLDKTGKIIARPYSAVEYLQDIQ